MQTQFEELKRAVEERKLCKREFLGLASMFGMSAAASYAFLGMPTPAYASELTPKSGGILKLAMIVREMGDPRTFDWREMGNTARLFCENLVRYNADFTFSGELLENWKISPDARRYTLHCRKDITWNNGDPFTVDDVIYNLKRWCDRSVEGNSMATRCASLIDPETGQLDEAAIERVDDYTVLLKLRTPDITLIPSMSDYPSLIVHRDFDTKHNRDLSAFPIGTGAFELVSYDAGTSVVAKRRESGWWGGKAYLDGVEINGIGTSNDKQVELFAEGLIHLNYQTNGNFVSLLDGLDLEQSQIDTAATLVCRMNTRIAPYDDKRVRNALQKAIDNILVLQLGIAGLGIVAENHHVCPIHPEYAALPQLERDIEGAQQLLKEADLVEFEHDLVSIDTGWQKLTADVIAGKMREAGVKVRRTALSGDEFWKNWANFPFSTTEWNMRPLGVQVLALAYRSGEAWNETGFDNQEFDEKLNQALGTVDISERRLLMEQIETILQDSGVIIQPFWRSLFCHFTSEVKGHSMHPSFEIHYDRIWLDA